MNDAWLLIGDFNNVLSTQDRVGGNPIHAWEYVDLEFMMETLGLHELDMFGNEFTWSNKHKQGVIYSKVDRAMANIAWFQQFPGISVEALAPGVSDHTPLMVQMQQGWRECRPYMFNFMNFLVDKPQFQDLVRRQWNCRFRGSVVFVVWGKLKSLQPGLKIMSRDYSLLESQIDAARLELDRIQRDLQRNRLDADMILQEKIATANLLLLRTNEEKVLHQRSKITWLKLGDSNNAYFHVSIREKQRKATIKRLITSSGVIVTAANEIEDEVLQFYSCLVGSASNERRGLDLDALRNGRQRPCDMAQTLIEAVFETEIYQALKDIGDEKASGIDGFNAKFFKDSWSIVKNDVVEAVLDFFNTNKMYKAVNCTLVTLLPKTPDAQEMKAMRPISCCTTLYKIISKVLTK